MVTLPPIEIVEISDTPDDLLTPSFALKIPPFIRLAGHSSGPKARLTSSALTIGNLCNLLICHQIISFGVISCVLVCLLVVATAQV